MRVDQLLNKLCLVKTRTIAKKACDKNLVRINEKIAKASANICENDVIKFQLYGYKNKIKIIQIPKGNVSKNNATDFYKIMEREKLEI
ncbi:MAG: RNA-binding protein [Candidatus Cloacimonetes bacterium]|jgi:ribosome-associated heat shock protein Hsp15|nr:RNA-binding protein [Candidatus Cloacimonadota bacterium]MBT6994456.1 RNA-binding protein [Candidatus Cloacimonadota bacterium]MBT7470239.1 RNA-binding protein [Candidatus Cloacimonadota bacterium]